MGGSNAPTTAPQRVSPPGLRVGMPILDAIRTECQAVAWSSGVRLARNGDVIAVSDDAEEVVLRVLPEGAPRSFTVHLWPDDPDWACDCPVDADGCAHVAAAVIAWTQASRKGAELPTVAPRRTPQPGRLGYRLERHPRGFRLDRVRIDHTGEHRQPGSLASEESGQRILVDEADLAVEKALGYRFGFIVPRERVTRLLEALAPCTDVKLDEQQIKVSGTPIVPVGRVDDASDGSGFRVRIVRDPRITEHFANGAVLCGRSLHPIGRGGLATDEWRVLTRGVVYPLEDVGMLVAEVLPRLRARIPVALRTKRLPAAAATPPRLVVRTKVEGEALSVEAAIVYGSPLVAEVKRGELVLHGETVPIRNRRAEQRLSREASERLGMAVSVPRVARGGNAVDLAERMRATGVPVVGDGLDRFERVEAVVPRITIDGDRFEVDFGGASPSRVIDAWMAGEGLVPVAGGWAPLPAGWLAEHGHRVADLLAARDAEGRVARHAMFDLARLCQALNQPPPPQLAGLRALLEDFSGLPSEPLPADLRADLRGYQRGGVDWMGFLSRAGLGGVLADDMGLGKTLQALCGMRGRTLVVAPTSVLHNWASEAERFRPGLKVCVYHGLQRRLDAEADLTITTYGVLRLDIESLSSIQWGTAILDEAQAIKNPTSQVAQAAFRLPADFRLTLTGTPVENRLDELWSQFHYVNPGLLGGRRDFQERYAKPIAVGEAGSAERLRERIRPFVLRRMKEEVAPELPARTDMVLRCTLSADERLTYDTVRAASRDKVVRELGQGGNVLAALEALLRMRQAACHPALVPGQEAESSSKVRLLLESLEQGVAEGHKALVFSQWTSLLDLVEPHLRARGVDFVRLDGSTRKRGEVVARFQSDDGPPVFLISLKAGGTGLNLTAADHVYLLDPWWNPAVEEQAADRAHRIGQDKPVFVYRLVADDTVEERILALQERKRALADAALGEADRAAAITREELLALFD